MRNFEKWGAPLPPSPAQGPTMNPQVLKDLQTDPWGMLSQQGQEESGAGMSKPEKHTVEPEIPGGPYHMMGGKNDRMTPKAAGYMELEGATKDGDCHKVAVPGGVSLKRGCCNEFERRTEETQQFSCGTCEYRKATNIANLVGEKSMNNEKKSSRELLRDKISAIGETKKAKHYARLREVSIKYAAKVGDALGELGYATSVVASCFSNLREQLDLTPAPRAATLQARVASRKKYALAFRELAENNPDQLAEAVVQLYQNIDEIAAGVENFAQNMGIELPSGEEEIPEAGFGNDDEGHGEMPTGGDFSPEGEGEVAETPDEQAEEATEGTEGSEEDNKEDAEEPVEKEAANNGSAGFVTDRDAEGKPKPPVKAATSGGFVTNRDQSAEPKPVETAEIPESQGEAAIKLGALRQQAGW